MGALDTAILPTAADIEAAAKRLYGVAVRTPLINAPVLDDLLGARVFLKAETLQRTGSFKFRGAYNKISSIPWSGAPPAWWPIRPAITRKAWRRPQRCSACAPCIVMPADAPRLKRERTAALGAEIMPVRPRHRGPRGHRQEDRGRARRHAGAALRRSADHRRAGHHRARDRRGSRAASAQAGDRGGRRLRRRIGGRHFARRQGARAGGQVLHRRAGGLRRHAALVQERAARGQCAHERHHLRRADEQHAGRADLSDQLAS